MPSIWIKKVQLFTKFLTELLFLFRDIYSILFDKSNLEEIILKFLILNYNTKQIITTDLKYYISDLIQNFEFLIIIMDVVY